MAEIDTLQVKITANAQSATASLNSLSKALQKVRTALTGMKDGVSITDHLSKSLNQMNGALNTISTGSIKKLQKLANALDMYASAASKLKGVSANVSNIIKDATETTPSASSGEAVTPGESSTGERSLSFIERLRIEYMKLWEQIDKTAKKTKESGGAFKNLFSSIKRIAFYRAIRSALKAISEAFSEGLKNAYYYAKQTGDLSNLAKTLDEVKSKTSQMVNQLGAFWGEIKQFVAPAIEWIAEKIRSIAEYLTELFAALNGDSYYQRAKLVAQSWDDAADAVDKYKHQLLGLDELNNLSAKNDTGKDKVGAAKEMFEDVAVRPEFKAVGETWQNIKKSISDALDGIYGDLLAPAAMAAIGAILLFTGHPFLGLGLIVAGCAWGVAEIVTNWDMWKGELTRVFEEYAGLIGAVAAVGFAIGMILLFTPTHFLLGLTLMVASGILGVADIVVNWTKIKNKVKKAFQKYEALFLAVAAVGFAIGMVLLFTPTHFLLGLSLMIASGILGVATVILNWEDLKSQVKNAFIEYRALFWTISAVGFAIGLILLFVPGWHALGITLLIASTLLGVATVVFNWDGLREKVKEGFVAYRSLFWTVSAVGFAIGLILMFIPGMQPLGISLMIASGILGVATIAFNWDFVLEKIKAAWNKIKAWWNETVKPAIDRVKEIIKSVFDPLDKILVGDLEKRQSNITRALEEQGFTINSDGSITKKAAGGIVEKGSLFYAGEAGAEFVGNIGSTSAVANTEQMTDAIYKAAYMGMSKALAENGGSNGMSGFVPASSDDLFLILRKKASNYNKMTGNSAFA